VHLVEQDAHQLRDGHARMRVVELDGDVVRKRAPIGVAARKCCTRSASEHATRSILHEAQSLAERRRVVEVEHAVKVSAWRVAASAHEVAWLNS
jgi:hypothetical protein